MRTIAAIALATLAGQAQALSCMRPTIPDSFERAAQVPEDIYVLKGSLTFDEDLLPETDMLNQEQNPAPIAAHFKGMALNLEGFTTRYARPVTLQPLCFGPWCGGAASGEEAIIFAKAVGDDLVVEANPCGGNIFYNVTRQTEQQAVACINGDCEAQLAE